ncbi:MAG TPA: MmcQ/YjbR family DNA-binding protein [Myxococcota bacterium]|nr:MmcQ/YjbR family DNA-binding protein [Myxococcota bacterium]
MSAAGAKKLVRFEKLCLALPEVTVERKGDYAAFRVRKKTFAYFLDDHHGDGVVSMCWKAALGENEELAQADPKRFFLPAYIGHRGWAGLRLDVGKVDWDEVGSLVLASYCAVAPARLAAEVES